MEWINILIKGLLGGFAAVGFGILFNVPKRVLIYIFFLGVLGVLLRNVLTEFGMNIILGSFIASAAIGSISVLFSHKRHAPPLVFSIPAVIPMIPGIYTYRAILGVIKLSGSIDDNYMQMLTESINNGLKSAFILMALAVGVGLPNFIPGQESTKRSPLFSFLNEKNRNK